eukprot:MONOS_4677.1-p1 / transcript=MONOS_4677.1 / gene=MONOS_4677 / organism=Monocercomonoides_exilis_PA203 / gene_product=unspecified product / transcript_product=unspecified product / location=Mono_scaffold00126:107301-108789(+) / protein_length=426 / sequence_SO=supercontig / SO=protein_coding / is_pseudo=false
MTSKQRLDRDALNVIQRAIQISDSEQKPQSDFMAKNLLDINDSPLIMPYWKAVALHFIPGFLAFVGYNILIKLIPNLPTLTNYYLASLLFVVPFELYYCMWMSKELTGRWIPNHLSQVFLYWPPHLAELRDDAKKRKKQQGDNEKQPTVFQRIWSLAKEVFALIKLYNTKQLLINFFWAYATFTFVGPYEQSIWITSIIPLISRLLKLHIFGEGDYGDNGYGLIYDYLSQKPLQCYLAAVGKITYNSVGGIVGLIVIMLSFVIVPLVEEFYYRGIALPALTHAQSVKKEKKRKEKDEEEDNNSNGKGKKGSSKQKKENSASAATKSKQVLSQKKGTTAEIPELVKQFVSSPISFFSQNQWLVNAFLYSLAYVAINPWIFLTRFFAFFPVTHAVEYGGNMGAAIQVQWMISAAQAILILLSVSKGGR